MERESPVSYSQQPATEPCLESADNNSRCFTELLFSYYLPIYVLMYQVGLYSQVLKLKSVYCSSH